MILLFAAVNRKQREAGSPYVPTGVFAFGYLAAWGAFSLLATAAQWGLERSGLLSSMMVGTSVILGALLLIAAGVWQLTPLKHACLKHCRSPLHFLSHHWRKGRPGAFRMGIESQLLDASALAEYWPWIERDDVLSAFYVPANGQVNPLDTTTALAKGARAKGAQIYEDTCVERLELHQGRVVGVVTDRGTIRTDRVLLAAGMWSHLFAKAHGVTFSAHGLVPMGSYSRVYRLDEPKAMHELYGSGSAQLGRLFGAGRFDRGLVMLLACVKELLAHVRQ